MDREDLDALVRKATVRGRLSTDEEMTEVFGYLNERLQACELTGEVVSVITSGTRGRVNCYGMLLDDGVVFRKLNMSVGGQGSRVQGTVTHRRVHRLTSYQEGYFVEGEEFGVKWDKKNPEKRPYIALVNVPIGEDMPSWRYSPNRP
jgi:hypothetical protein